MSKVCKQRQILKCQWKEQEQTLTKNVLLIHSHGISRELSQVTSGPRDTFKRP